MRTEFNTMNTSKDKNKVDPLATAPQTPEQPVNFFGGRMAPPASESMKRLDAAIDKVESMPDLQLH